MALIEIPGAIDPHVHLRQPGGEHKEDFRTGTRAAIAGGVTMVVDMPNNPQPIDSMGRMLKKMNLAKGKVHADIGFHYIGTQTSISDMDMMGSLAIGMKVYMNETTGSFLEEDPNKLRRIFEAWKHPYPIIVHAEGDKLAEAIGLSHNTNRRIHVAHVSLEEEVAMIKKAKEMGLPITAEVTPHHLFLTDHDVSTLGAYGVMKPPLSTQRDQHALWNGLRSGVIDLVATDHAPHTIAEKESQNPPSGVPGLETSIPLLIDAMLQGRIDKDELIRITSGRAREIFNLPEQDSKIIIDTTTRSVLIGGESKCGWTPFEGWITEGKIVEVSLRGEKVFNGEEVSDVPTGRVINRIPGITQWQ